MCEFIEGFADFLQGSTANECIERIGPTDFSCGSPFGIVVRDMLLDRTTANDNNNQRNNLAISAWGNYGEGGGVAPNCTILHEGTRNLLILNGGESGIRSLPAR